MIEKLTKEQEAQLEVYREKWINIGLMPLKDRPKISEDEMISLIGDLYKQGGLKPPKKVIFAKSLKEAEDICHDLMVEVGLRTKKDTGFVWPIYGCYDAGWCAWTAYCDEILNIPKLETTRPLRRLAEVAGFVITLKGVCIVSSPHTEIHLDEDGELHNEEGPAIMYEDGYSLYAIHGHVIPDYIITNPEKITLEVISKESNAETRRIMIDFYPGGPGKFLADSKAEVLDTDSVPTDSQDKNSPHLMRALVRVGSEIYLVGTDGSTRRTYYMPVDGNPKTCKEAHESIMPFGLKDDQLVNQS